MDIQFFLGNVFQMGKTFVAWNQRKTINYLVMTAGSQDISRCINYLTIPLVWGGHQLDAVIFEKVSTQSLMLLYFDQLCLSERIKLQIPRFSCHE